MPAALSWAFGGALSAAPALTPLSMDVAMTMYCVLSAGSLPSSKPATFGAVMGSATMASLCAISKTLAEGSVHSTGTVSACSCLRSKPTVCRKSRIASPHTVTDSREPAASRKGASIITVGR